MKEIDDIKTIGMKEALYRAITGALWDARNSLEKAPSGNCDDFNRKIEDAKNRIEFAEKLYAEWKLILVIILCLTLTGCKHTPIPGVDQHEHEVLGSPVPVDPATLHPERWIETHNEQWEWIKSDSKYFSTLPDQHEQP